MQTAPNRQHGVAAPVDLPVIATSHELNRKPRTREQVAMDLRIDAAMGRITRDELRKKLEKLGVAVDDPLADETARIIAETRQRLAEGKRLREQSEYARRSLGGRLGR